MISKTILSKNLVNMYFISLTFVLVFSFSCNKKEKETEVPSHNTINIVQDDISIAPHLKNMNSASAETPDGKSLPLILAITPEEQEKGLSGVQPNEWPGEFAMLFPSLEDTYRTFWMPDTYFDLDIFFLDKDLKIIGIERKVKHHPGRENEKLIPRTRSYLCRHVMEMHSDSSISLSLNVGDKITWKDSYSLEQIVSNTLLKK